MVFWASAVQVAAKLESLKVAEVKLLDHAKKYVAAGVSLDSLKITSYDTPILRSVIGWKQRDRLPLMVDLNEKDDELLVHAVHVESTATANNASTTSNTSNNKIAQTPLVLLHGYMNASAYFYRNLLGLTRFYRSIYSLDLLGWGLSSRPDFNQLKDTSVESSEEFFVESLEAWRIQNKIDKMILAGHSMGGYLSVAYCEKYPQNVERLILLSPVGVNDKNSQNFKDREARINSSYRSWAMFGIFRAAFVSTTPAAVLRAMPESRAYNLALGYVQRRLPEIEGVDEQTAVSNYLFQSNTLPGSGEYALSRILESTVTARRPLQFRIPKLEVPNVSFLYGSHDWMDISGGTTTQALCRTAGDAAPKIQVHVVNEAGHLLMLQNWRAVNAGLILCGGGEISDEERKELTTLDATAGNDADDDDGVATPEGGTAA